MLKSLSEYGFGRNFSYSMVDYDACKNEKSTENENKYYPWWKKRKLGKKLNFYWNNNKKSQKTD